MARIRAREFLRSQGAGVTVEFVVLMPAFLLTTLFVMEISIAVLWIGTAEKAAQLGARLAVVSHYAASRTYDGGPVTESTRYAVTTGHVYGQNCNEAACVPFDTMTCTGGTGEDCRAGDCFGGPNNNRTCFEVIADRIRNPNADVAYRGIMSSIQDENITIAYSYVGLGYAGGPLVPSVTVTITGVPYPTIMTSVVSNLFAFILGASAPPGLTTLPPITVTLTGEDQSTAGVIGT